LSGFESSDGLILQDNNEAKALKHVSKFSLLLTEDNLIVIFNASDMLGR